MKDDYSDVYKRAKQDLAEKLAQQARLEQEIAQLKQFIVGLEAVGISLEANVQEAVRPDGLKEACLQVLMASGKPMTAGDVARYLPLTGLDMRSYSNVIAPVTTTLKRLASSGEIETTEIGSRPAYQWDYNAMVKRFNQMQELVKKQTSKRR